MYTKRLGVKDAGLKEDKMNFISSRIYTENISQWPVYDPGVRAYSADICINTQEKTKMHDISANQLGIYWALYWQFWKLWKPTVSFTWSSVPST